MQKDPWTEMDAENWRLLQAEALLELFRRDTGRDPANLEELQAWRSRQVAMRRPIDPTLVLTPERIAEVMKWRTR